MPEHRPAFADIGRRVYGTGAIVLGASNLVAGDFATLWEPVQPGVPFRTALACATGVLLVLGGIAVWSRRSVRVGAIILGVLYAGSAALWLPRVIGFPQIYGTWGGFFEELAPATAALIVYGASVQHDPARGARLAQLGRYAFGVCAVSFGVAHFTAIPQTAAMVPTWISPSPRFWATATGIFHVLAGIAILTGVLAVVGARLLTAMLIAFGVLIWLPRLVHNPGAHTAWAGNAVNLTIAGAAWVTADWLARRHRYAGARPRE